MPAEPLTPDHNHPEDSLCLYRFCPRGAWDAARAAHTPSAGEGLDVERLWRVLDRMGVLADGAWVAFQREDAKRIARKYAALSPAPSPTEPEESAGEGLDATFDRAILSGALDEFDAGTVRRLRSALSPAPSPTEIRHAR